MNYFNIFLIAIALSFDAMAVAMASGARDTKIPLGQSLKIAFFFGLFQLAMPIIGWLAGLGLEQILARFDHWIAFLLLTIIGLKMVLESFKTKKERSLNIHSFKILILLAIATSIDALVVGVTFALLPINVWSAVGIIGLTTFILSLISVYIGKKCGERWGRKSELAGGLILIFIGLKILIQHISF